LIIAHFIIQSLAFKKTSSLLWGPLSSTEVAGISTITGAQWLTSSLERGSFCLVEYHEERIATWWFQFFLILIPKIGGDEPILTSIFFKGIGSTTNQIVVLNLGGSTTSSELRIISGHPVFGDGPLARLQICPATFSEPKKI